MGKLKEILMVRPVLKVVMVGIVGLSLSMFSLGCSSVGVVYEEPGYKREPPPPPSPPREQGPPPWAPAHGYRAKYQYRYYPESQVYYDSGRGVYFYYEDGRWRVSVSLPSSIHIEVNDYISLDMDTDEPYKYHADVVERYPPGKQKKKSKGKGKNK